MATRSLILPRRIDEKEKVREKEGLEAAFNALLKDGKATEPGEK